MGFMDKVKNLFTEEEEVLVEPVKKEVIQVEIPAPSEEKKEASFARDIQKAVKKVEEKQDDKFSFPVFFDDKDFESLEKPKKKKEKPTTLKREEAYQAKGNLFEEKKVFKPSPIISPVYGVLDKNYKKEEISDKRLYADENGHKQHKLDIDDVRNKAFGTLEDEIDTAFTNDDVASIRRETYQSKNTDLEEDLLDGLGYSNAEDDSDMMLSSNENMSTNDDFDMMDEKKLDDHDIMDDLMDSPSSTEEEDLNLNESDLFNLIDSMYEKRDEE